MLALLLALACGCGADEVAPVVVEGPRSVLFVTIDTLRQDFVSAYGASWANTPVMDALAEEGALLERHYTTMAHTAPAHASLFTGLYPREHGLRRNGGTLDPELRTLPEVFQEAGYHTAATIGALVVESSFGFGRGFERFDQEFERRGNQHMAERNATQVVDSALALLAEAPEDRPLFLWLHFYDPHTPLRSPLREDRTKRELRETFAPLLEASKQWTADQARATFANYEREVRYTDRELARFLRSWDERFGDQQAVFVTSDHGEGICEHEYEGHGLHVYEEQLLIPAVIRAPGLVPAGTRVLPTTSAVDVPNTLLQLAGQPASEELGGRSLLPLLLGQSDGREALALGERRMYSEFDMRNKPELMRRLIALWGPGPHPIGQRIALMRGRWKLIWDEHRPSELYDLSSDPRELVDLASEEPDRVETYEALVESWLASAQLLGTGTDPTTADDPEVRAMLDALGY